VWVVCLRRERGGDLELGQELGQELELGLGLWLGLQWGKARERVRGDGLEG
jgi:hypothetical protein